MKISEVALHKVNIPFEAPLRWSGGVEYGWTLCVVRMRTDDGLEGIGETLGGTPTMVQLEAVKEGFVGEDPFDLERILKKFWWVPFYHGTTGRLAIGGLEMACWDLMGKAVGRPVCQLLGGKLRTKMTIKLKGGVLPPKDEFAATAALREAFPDHRLRFDPNGLWSVETAIRLGKRFEALDLEYYEDPVWGIEGMSRARRDVRIPFAANMCVTNLDDLPTGIRTGAIDVLLGDLQEWGGITAVRKAAATCQAFQIGFNLPTGPGLGVEIDEERLGELEDANRRDGDFTIFEHHEEQRRDPPFQGQW